MGPVASIGPSPAAGTPLLFGDNEATALHLNAGKTANRERGGHAVKKVQN